MLATRAWWIALVVCGLVACGDDSNRVDSAPGDSMPVSGDSSSTPDAPPCQGDQCSCPPATESRCGDPCSAPQTGCLCTCGGGGPNFTACGCIDGTLECPSC